MPVLYLPLTGVDRVIIVRFFTNTMVVVVPDSVPNVTNSYVYHNPRLLKVTRQDYYDEVTTSYLNREEWKELISRNQPMSVTFDGYSISINLRNANNEREEIRMGFRWNAPTHL